MKLVAVLALLATPLSVMGAPLIKRQVIDPPATTIDLPATTIDPPATVIDLPATTISATPGTPTPTGEPQPGDEEGSAVALPPGLEPFGPEGTASLTLWQVLEGNPSFSNYTSLATRYAPELVAQLNNTAAEQGESAGEQPQLPVTASQEGGEQGSGDQGGDQGEGEQGGGEQGSGEQGAGDQGGDQSGNGQGGDEQGGDGQGGAAGNQQPRRWTVFAPTDLAMTEVLASPFTRALLATNNDTAIAPIVSRFLAYHVVDGEVFARDVPPAGSNLTAPTLAGLDLVVQRSVDPPQEPFNLPPLFPTQTATITAAQAAPSPTPAANERVWANTAEVVFPDVQASNGMLHVVDSAIEPLFGLSAMPPLDVPPLKQATTVAVPSPSSTDGETGEPTLPLPTPQ